MYSVLRVAGFSWFEFARVFFAWYDSDAITMQDKRRETQPRHFNERQKEVAKPLYHLRLSNKMN